MKKMILIIFLFALSVYGQSPTMDIFRGDEGVTADVTAPSAPTNLAAVGRENAIDVTYNTVADAVMYYIFRALTANPTTLIDSTTSIAYIDTAHSYGTVYNYRVKARDASYNYSDYSSNVSDTVLVSFGSEMITDQTDRDFSGANNWVDVIYTTFDNTDDLSVTADGIGLWGKLENTYMTQYVIGHTYKLIFTASALTGSWYLFNTDASIIYVVGIPNGLNNIIFTATSTNASFRPQAIEAGGITLDDFSVKEILNP